MLYLHQYFAADTNPYERGNFLLPVDAQRHTRKEERSYGSLSIQILLACSQQHSRNKGYPHVNAALLLGTAATFCTPCLHRTHAKARLSSPIEQHNGWEMLNQPKSTALQAETPNRSFWYRFKEICSLPCTAQQDAEPWHTTKWMLPSANVRRCIAGA